MIKAFWGGCGSSHLHTGRHGYVEVTQYVLCVLILGTLPQEGQKPSGILVTISDLTQWKDGQRERRRRRRWRGMEKRKEKVKRDGTKMKGGIWKKDGNRVRDRIHRREREREQERRRGRRRKRNRSKLVSDPSTMLRACGAITWDEKQGKQGWKQSTGRQEGEIYLHTLPGRLSDQTVTEWPWERERETVRQTHTDRQGRKIGRQAEKVRESQGVQTITRESRQVDR